MEKQVSLGPAPEEEQGRPRTREKNHEGACRIQELGTGTRPCRQVVSWCREGHQAPREAGWGGCEGLEPQVARPLLSPRRG